MARPERLDLPTFWFVVKFAFAISLIRLGSAYSLYSGFLGYSGVNGPILDPTFGVNPCCETNLLGTFVKCAHPDCLNSRVQSTVPGSQAVTCCARPHCALYCTTALTSSGGLLQPEAAVLTLSVRVAPAE